MPGQLARRQYDLGFCWLLRLPAGVAGVAGVGPPRMTWAARLQISPGTAKMEP